MKKHKYDVFRLLQITNIDNPIQATGIVFDAVKEFVEVITDEKLPLIQLGLPFDADEGIRLLKQLYGV